MSTTVNQSKPLKVMQFGGGNFLRAFSLWMIDILNKESDFNAGVAIIKPTKHGDYHLLRKQKGTYHVLLNGYYQGALRKNIQKVECIQAIINPYREWDSYLQLAEVPSIRFIISNTTEAGITFFEKDRFADCPPKEFPAKLTRWLYHRFVFFKADPSKGCIILPCELIEANGEELRKCIVDYAVLWSLPEDFTNWVLHHNFFFNTLVDRIVSGFPTKVSEDLFKEIGEEDPLLVAGEFYHSWIIEGSEIFQQEWPLSNKRLHIQQVENLDTYRDMKVRLLNGAHTLLVPLGLMTNILTVRAAVNEPTMETFLLKTLDEEIIPSLGGRREECDEFAKNVLERFKNPAIEHQLKSISLNTIAKFKTRLLPSIIEYIALKDAIPKRLVFVWAAVIVYYRGEYRGTELILKDDKAIVSYFRSVWALNDVQKIAREILANKTLWGISFDKELELEDLLANYLREIDEKGVKMQMKSLS